MSLNSTGARVGAIGRMMPAEVEAVILAAGRGSRLASVTTKRPKCLIEIGGSPLIEHQLRMLEMAGIKRVAVVAGYRADIVRKAVQGRARVIENGEWNDTNSLYSLFICRDHVRASMLVLNCDVLIHPLALQRLLSAHGSAFLYDSSSGNSDEHMKVELDHSRLKAMSKVLPAHRTHGENVGILYFRADAAHVLFRRAGDLVAKGKKNTWMAAAVEGVARSFPLYAVDVVDLPWIEIDFPEDFSRARKQVWRQVACALAPAMRLSA